MKSLDRTATLQLRYDRIDFPLGEDHAEVFAAIRLRVELSITAAELGLGAVAAGVARNGDGLPCAAVAWLGAGAVADVLAWGLGEDSRSDTSWRASSSWPASCCCPGICGTRAAVRRRCPCGPPPCPSRCAAATPGAQVVATAQAEVPGAHTGRSRVSDAITWPRTAASSMRVER
ncbi:hypothetical protein [Streptomyces sanglieri]|uniref:hypothetical protein n=1 Tax=Streptomyces sanglieri TaxID=193460 RepID=UPI0035269E50